MRSFVFIRFQVVLVCLFSLFACNRYALDVPDPVSVSDAFVVEEGYVDALPVSIGVSGDFGTKGTILSGVESVGHGALLLCYRSSTGVFECGAFFTQAQLDNAASVPLKLSRVPVDECDFFVLGNLPLIDKNGELGAVNMLTALGSGFPSTEGALSAFVYRLDASTYGSSRWRFIDAEEVATYGLPYIDAVYGVNVEALAASNSGIPGLMDCRRLYAKVNLSIDHSAFDNGGSNVDWMVNHKLKVRCANCMFKPFYYTGHSGTDVTFYNQKADSGSDIYNNANWVDYDLSMASDNGHITNYTLYVPENMQGTLLGGNVDPAAKTYGNVDAAHRDIITFIQLEAGIDASYAGLAGEGEFRFYLGSDNITNFDVEGGKEYNVSLSFNNNSIVNPYWKVDFTKSTDSRILRVRKLGDHGDDLGETKVAVRKNRPGTVYVFANPTDGSGTNELLGGSLNPSFYSPSSLTDYAIVGDFSAIHSMGIYESFDASTGALSFSVPDADVFRDAFNTYMGSEPWITLTLLPDPSGGASITRSFQLKLVENMGVTVDGGEYVAQYRYLYPYGFSGTVSMSESKGSANWVSAPISGGWTIGALHPGSGSVTISSSDTFNDGSVVVPVNVGTPILARKTMDGSGGTQVTCPIDGTERYAAIGYYYPGETTFDESTRLKRGSEFSWDLYDYLGMGNIVLATDSGDRTIMEYLRVNDSTGEIYMGSTTGSLGNAEDWAYTSTVSGKKNQYRIGELYLGLYGSGLDDVYPARYTTANSDYRITGYVSKLMLSGFDKLYEYMYDGSYTLQSTGSGPDSDGYFRSGYFSDVNDWEPYPGYSYHSNKQMFSTIRTTGARNGFGVSYSFYFQYGDFSSITWSRSGTANVYTTPSGVEVGPSIRHSISVDDSGNGGTGLWEFREDEQPWQVNGELVPGGLCVPYGQQQIGASMTNKHDGRSFSCGFLSGEGKFKIRYSGVSMGVFVVARAGDTSAQVCPMPQKAIYYLKWMVHHASASALTKAQRDWVVNLFQSNFRTSYDFGVNGLYRRHTYGDFQIPSPGTPSFPRSDYYISSLSSLVTGSSSTFSIWNQLAMDYLNHWDGIGTYIDTNNCPMYSWYIIGSSSTPAQSMPDAYIGNATLCDLAVYGMIWDGSGEFWTTY